MMYEIQVGANRNALRAFATELLKAFDKDDNSEVTMRGHLNAGGGVEEVVIMFNNFDMERDDVKDTDIYVDIERS